MIWNILMAAVLVLSTVSCVRTYNYVRKNPSRYRSEWKGVQYAAVWSSIVAGVMLMISMVALGFNSNDVSMYKRSGELVTMKQQQRDALATIVKEELSTDQYAAIMAATPDTDVLIILGNNAATFLVEKTKLLVSLNAEVNSLVNGLANDRISLCAYADNPISPRLFVSPECPATIPAATP